MLPITHFTFLGFRVAEPVTALTDFILTAMCFAFYFQLVIRKQEARIQPWRLFFLFMGFSTLLGAITHGWFENHNIFGYNFLWSLMQLFSGLSVFYAQLATIKNIENTGIPIYSTPEKSVLFCRLQLFVFFISVIVFQSFLTVVINSTLGFLMVLYIQLVANKKGNRSAGWIAFGITISFITAIVHALKISVNEWFTYKDFAHVIMMISLSIMFYGVGLIVSDNEKVSILI